MTVLLTALYHFHVLLDLAHVDLLSGTFVLPGSCNEYPSLNLYFTVKHTVTFLRFKLQIYNY